MLGPSTRKVGNLGSVAANAWVDSAAMADVLRPSASLDGASSIALHDQMRDEVMFCFVARPGTSEMPVSSARAQEARSEKPSPGKRHWYGCRSTLSIMSINAMLFGAADDGADVKGEVPSI